MMHRLSSFARILFGTCCVLQVSSSSATEATPVTVRPLADLIVYPAHTAPATALSRNNAEISAEISGRVTQIPVRVGDSVKKGDVLSEIACGDYEIKLKQAQSALQQAMSKLSFYRSQLASARALSKAKSISQEALDERISNQSAGQADVERMEASVEQAKLDIRRCQVQAPFNAVVVERLGAIGELAVPGTKLVRILDSENVDVSASIQESDLESLKEAGSLWFENSRNRYPLRLRALLPVMDSKARSFEARLEFSETKAPPGAVGRLVWRDHRAYVPPDLLVRRGGRLGVFVYDSGSVTFKPINGAQEGRFARVDDLSQNPDILIDGRHSVQDGDAVTVVP